MTVVNTNDDWGWRWYDTIARHKANIPDGYELRAIDTDHLQFIATYRRKVDGGYDMEDELVYRVTDADAFSVSEGEVSEK